MELFSRMFLFSVMLCSTSLAAALELPPPFTVTLYGQPFYIGKVMAEISFERIGSYLKYSMLTKGEILIHRNELYDCSVMQVREGKIYALEHRHTDSSKHARDASTRFDWVNGTAAVSLGDGSQMQVDGLTWPVWDPISLQVKVMIDLLNGELNGGKVYRLLERGEMSNWPLRQNGERKLRTEHAEVQAVGMQRTDGKSYQLWFAKDYRYLPVQVDLDNVSVTLVSDPAAAHRTAPRTHTDVPRC